MHAPSSSDRDSKYFECKCKRCADSTELGTNFSTLRCKNPSCDGGLVTPKDPLDVDSDWSCILCFEVRSLRWEIKKHQFDANQRMT